MDSEKNLNKQNSDLLGKIERMLDTLPMMSFVRNLKGQVVYCNDALCSRFEVADKMEIITDYDRFVPEIQPDGKRSDQLEKELLERVIRTGKVEYDFTYLTKSGKQTEIKITCVTVSDNKDPLAKKDTPEEGWIIFYGSDTVDLLTSIDIDTNEAGQTLMLLDTLPVAACLFSKDYQLVDCNEAAVKLFWAENKQQLEQAFFTVFSPEKQPDGESSITKSQRFIDQAFEGEELKFEWTHKKSDGTAIDTQITLIKVKRNDDDENLIAAYANDLQEIKHMQSKLLRKSQLLETVNKIAERLLPANINDLKEEEQDSLKLLAESLTVDRVSIWKNQEEREKLCGCLLESWPPENSDVQTIEICYDDLPYWKETIFNNQVINGPIQHLPEAERVQLQKVGVRSVLAIPLVIRDTIWGFMRIDDFSHDRIFEDAELQAARSASALLASSWHQYSTTQELLNSNRELSVKRNILTAVNHVAELILSSDESDFPYVIQRSLMLLGQSVEGIVAASLWENYYSKKNELISTRLPYWEENKSFRETNIVKSYNIYDFIPQWQSTDALQSIALKTDDMSDVLRKFVISKQGKTILLIPLFLQDKFWGFVAFISLKEDGAFSEEEKSYLRSGSLMIAESLMRNEITDNLSRVRQIAERDALTGLLNRRSFLSYAEQLFDRKKSHAEVCSVMFLDIDHFKTINDTYGHAFGDEVLKMFGLVVSNSIRPTDICARYGGEEFVIVLEEGDEQGAMTVAERIMKNVQEIVFSANADFKMTVSIGLVSRIPKGEELLAHFIEWADDAVYKAKDKGRNRIEVYE